MRARTFSSVKKCPLIASTPHLWNTHEWGWHIYVSHSKVWQIIIPSLIAKLQKNTLSLWCLNWMDNSLWNRPWSRAGSRFRPCGGRCCPWVLGVTCVLLETQEKQPNKSVHGWLCEVFQLLWKRFVYAYFVSQGSCFLACYDSLLRKLLNYSKDYFFAFPMLATFGKMWRSKKQGF